MKTNQQKMLAAIIILITVATFSSCKKEQSILQPKTKTNLISINDTYETMLRATMSLSNSGSFKTEGVDAIPGAIVTDDTLSMPHTRIIDYGSEGCLGNDGKVYKGQMILTYTSTDFLHENGGYVTVTPSNYSVDDNQITGTSTLQNNGINGNGNISYTYTIDAKREWVNNGGTDSLGGQQTIEWVAGSNTPEKIDDQFSFTGSISGIASHDGNVNFTTNILQPLIQNRTPGCNQFYVKGETVTQILGQSDRYLDYGDGTCDNLGVETVDGVSTTITLD